MPLQLAQTYRLATNRSHVSRAGTDPVGSRGKHVSRPNDSEQAELDTLREQLAAALRREAGCARNWNDAVKALAAPVPPL